MKALKRSLVTLAILLALGICAVLGSYGWYRLTHVKIDGIVYDKHEKTVDLRGQDITPEQYMIYRENLPEAEIFWDVPFQDRTYPNDTTEITVDKLTPEDVDRLGYLPGLSHVDASQCRDYEALITLEKMRPGCQVDFSIHMGDMAVDRNASELHIEKDAATGQELQDAMAYLPGLKTVTLSDPSIPAEDLYALQKAHPDMAISWDKEFLGETYDMNLKELDISNTKPESLQYVEETLSYFPDFEKVVMEHCGFTDPDMAEFRERVRDKYQVIWGVQVGEGYVRTDAIGFIPSNSGWHVTNEEMNQLQYCEGLIAVDIGHTNIGNLDWVKGTPHLKYLIVGDGNVFNKNIVPLSCLKELEYLEIFHCPVTDVSPLVECTGLRDLLLSGCYVDVEPLGKMTWLNNLWLVQSGIHADERAYLEEHLPDVNMHMGGGSHHGGGWRNLPNYYKMRDALGMWYMKG